MLVLVIFLCVSWFKLDYKLFGTVCLHFFLSLSNMNRQVKLGAMYGTMPQGLSTLGEGIWMYINRCSQELALL